MTKQTLEQLKRKHAEYSALIDSKTKAAPQKCQMICCDKPAKYRRIEETFYDRNSKKINGARIVTNLCKKHHMQINDQEVTSCIHFESL